NSADYLRQCLLSLYRETHGICYEVIVVDNASHDGCAEMLRSEFPTVRLIQSGENLGFSRANNLGYRLSLGEIVLFLNPDTEIIGNVLPKMVAHLRASPEVGAAGARLLNSDGSLQTSCVQAFPTLWNQWLDFELLRSLFPSWNLWGTRPLLEPQASRPAKVDAISGACFMVKRSAFEEAGRFNENYFMYSEDMDLSYRINKAGYLIHYLDECRVIHHGGKSSEKQADNFSDVAQRESLARFFRATRGRLYCGVYRAGMAVIAVLRLVMVLCFAPFAGLGLQGKPPRLVFRKWTRILRWGVGLGGSYTS
ncbi:MAG TPA: glycosyltransferase family 2 protein, partial [Terriglobia bacterium]|nr:glycosyltransferase family 2 protein [Terriglobia bacterium]